MIPGKYKEKGGWGLGVGRWGWGLVLSSQRSVHGKIDFVAVKYQILLTMKPKKFIL
jgi:hypothetical protein